MARSTRLSFALGKAGFMCRAVGHDRPKIIKPPAGGPAPGVIITPVRHGKAIRHR